VRQGLGQGQIGAGGALPGSSTLQSSVLFDRAVDRMCHAVLQFEAPAASSGAAVSKTLVQPCLKRHGTAATCGTPLPHTPSIGPWRQLLRRKAGSGSSAVRVVFHGDGIWREEARRASVAPPSDGDVVPLRCALEPARCAFSSPDNRDRARALLGLGQDVASELFWVGPDLVRSSIMCAPGPRGRRCARHARTLRA
jgi:hypothetical protein